jgi:hypothetical protein
MAAAISAISAFLGSLGFGDLWDGRNLEMKSFDLCDSAISAIWGPLGWLQPLHLWIYSVIVCAGPEVTCSYVVADALYALRCTILAVT